MSHTMDASTWQRLRAQHVERVAPWIDPRLRRRSRGEHHPIDDFLFDYYAWRPAQLARWHPGAGVVLTGDVAEFRRMRGYCVDMEASDGRAWADPRSFPIEEMRVFLGILRSTASRPPVLSCFGRHEWAMVYRLEENQIRHATWPLRLAPDVIARVVEETPLRCTHFDAFRFYADAARPLNVVQPRRETQADLEQPGCLHATMDLYKWCFRSYPAIGADLTADCFELAREVRLVDMRASPYDLRDLGCDPIAIETPAGRAEYVEHQRDFAERGARLRTRVIEGLQAALGKELLA
jgi:hypothetical protein